MILVFLESVCPFNVCFHKMINHSKGERVSKVFEVVCNRAKTEMDTRHLNKKTFVLWAHSVRFHVQGLIFALPLWWHPAASPLSHLKSPHGCTSLLFYIEKFSTPIAYFKLNIIKLQGLKKDWNRPQKSDFAMTHLEQTFSHINHITDNKFQQELTEKATWTLRELWF